jgi:hypothetical protein
MIAQDFEQGSGKRAIKMLHICGKISLFEHFHQLKGVSDGDGAQKRKSPARKLGQVVDSIGAGERNRTLDLLITNELLYRLSYTGTHDNLSCHSFKL